MEIAPLALVVLLGYGLLIAVSLTAWTAVTYRDEQPVDVSRPEVKKSRPAKARQLSNDDVRGAKSRRARRGSEPFEEDQLIPERKERPERQAAGAGSNEAVQPQQQERQAEPVRPKPASSAPENRKPLSRKPVTVTTNDTEEDAFERFLRPRPDDFDIR